MSQGGTPLNAVNKHWMEGNEADGSAGVEWAVPAGAKTVEFYSDVDAYCGLTTEALLDIAGAGFNAWPITANSPSLQFMLGDATSVAIKARTGNLGIVAVRWGGEE